MTITELLHRPAPPAARIEPVPLLAPAAETELTLLDRASVIAWLVMLALTVAFLTAVASAAL